MIYLDNAATSHPKPESVYQIVDTTLRHYSANPGRSGHRLANAAARMIFEARESVARLLGVSQSDRIIFTPNATGALNLAINGLLEPGDHCITSSMEHNSVVRPLYALEKRGVSVTKVTATPQGLMNADDITASITDHTKLIAVTHASNVTGTLTPIAEIVSAAHRRGVPVLVDASQTAGAVPIDIEGLGIDLLACPGHKSLLGPQGTGILYVGPGVSLKPILSGGTGSRSDLEEMPEFLPDRYEAGTLNTPGIAGLGAAAEFLLKTGVAAVRRHEMLLCDNLLSGLARIDGLRTYGVRDSGARASVVLFTLDGVDPALIGDRLDTEFDIAVRVGIHCAPAAHRTIGTYPIGGVRLSPGFFNTVDETNRVIDAVAIIAQDRCRLDSAPRGELFTAARI